jgi:hypothetical protein
MAVFNVPNTKSSRRWGTSVSVVVFSHITTAARNGHYGDKQMAQHDVGTRLRHVRTLQVRDESRFLQPVCVAKLAACCQ